ncbi:MAG: hypothetical protein SWX82_34350 [Cyanobacteriota bacterium]|nr:hypothetical protein [Cyanobacteriota bacterium]
MWEVWEVWEVWEAWEASVFRPNFLVLKGASICTFFPTKILKTLYLSAFRLDLPALLDESHTLLMHNR